MRTWTLDGKTVQVFPSKTPGRPLVLVNNFAEAVAPLCTALTDAPDHTLVTVTGMNWEDDLSPWPATALGRQSSAFAGHAAEYLCWMEKELLPMVEAELTAPPCWRGLAGYSLAGLFAVYTLYRSTAFERVASMSGSLWFEDFCDFALQEELAQRPQCVYFSLGDREKKTRHPLMRQVEENALAVAERFRELGVDTFFCLEPGGHFQDAAGRTARGITWLLER